MNNQCFSIKALIEHNKKQQEKEMQPKIQITELQKQSAILVDSKQITKENAEIMRLLLEQNKQNAVYTRQILECTKQNQISSNHQFRASFIVSIVALIVALVSLFK